jgi:hypothetical protein
MRAAICAGAGFLIAVLWFDLMFDVQARRGGTDRAPDDALASICAYYRRVTTEAKPMPRLIAAVMLGLVLALVAEIVLGAAARWASWVSLAAALGAIGLARARTVPFAVRLGRATDGPEVRTRLARTVLQDHLACLAAMVLVLALQLVGGR